MDELVANLRDGAAASASKTLAWMDDATRAEAHDEARRLHPRIGYPTKWRDYSALRDRRGDPARQRRRAPAPSSGSCASRASASRSTATEWGMTPQTVNAYYNPTMNEIVFPAAILQPPFFDPDADPAVNYGAIGAVIGHEIGHGFDDQGRKSDGAGKLRDWWTEDDGQKFAGRRPRSWRRSTTPSSRCPSACVNGKLTMGENIGDLGGLAMAYRAYTLSLGGKEAAGDRRLHRRPALLHGLGAGLARPSPARRRAAPAAPDRPALPRRSSASTAPSATSTPGTRRSTSSRATRSTCRPSSASTSGSARGPRPQPPPLQGGGAASAGGRPHASFVNPAGR